MRKAIASFAPMLMRLDVVERRQITDQAKNDANQVHNEERFKLILDAMQDKSFPPQKVFYDGQIYDAFEQMKKFVRMARTELIIIDPYFADSVLPLVAQKRQGVLKGAATLDGEWQTVTEENKAGFRFFKVVVEVP